MKSKVSGVAPKWLPRISSDFALLDVKLGRNELLALSEGPNASSDKPTILIEGRVVGAWGGDDGYSREFALDVVSLRWAP